MLLRLIDLTDLFPQLQPPTLQQHQLDQRDLIRRHTPGLPQLLNKHLLLVLLVGTTRLPM